MERDKSFSGLRGKVLPLNSKMEALLDRVEDKKKTTLLDEVGSIIYM